MNENSPNFFKIRSLCFNQQLMFKIITPEVIVDVDWVTREELDEEARTAYDEATDEGSAFIYEMWSVDEEPPPEDEGEACL